MFLFAFLFLSVWHFPILISQQLCSLQESCDLCLSAGADCVWCADLTLIDNSTTRCMIRDTQNSCSNIQDVVGNFTILEDIEFSQQVQIRPQKVKVRLRPGESITFNATVKPAPNFPLDLYYLMDLSYSMRDDLENLRSLSVEIASRIFNISSDSRLGFGSFVDKPLAPFISTTPSNLVDPCGSSCEPAYSFHHILNLTTDIDLFTDLIANTKISGNLDIPEGSMDALLQVR
ncbi:CD18 precursor [Oopsacas minuta]|uniref:Integrin beta n=1 Tax=Oopsacas minuta TaxID=111878 RepID=A0AAV7JE16_9METZ|nr:CD18 precursor [Oopsacas minuta]